MRWQNTGILVFWFRQAFGTDEVNRMCVHIISSGSIVAIEAKNTMIPMIGQRAACAEVHPLVFASFSVVIAPGMVAANM